MAQIRLSWTELELPAPIQLLGQQLLVSPGIPRPLASVLLAGQQVGISQGLLNGGVRRVRLSWTELELPASVVTTAALTGQALTIGQGGLLAGNRKVRLAWTALELPRPNSLFGLEVSVSPGVLTPFVGALQTFTGQEVGVQPGTLGTLRYAPLVGQQVTVGQGVLTTSDDNYIFAGILTPLTSVPLVGQQVDIQKGLPTIVTDGVVVVPLLGQSITLEVGSFGGQVAVDFQGQAISIVSGFLTGSLAMDAVVPLVGQEVSVLKGLFSGLTPPPIPVQPSGNFSGSGGGRGSGGGGKDIDMAATFTGRVERLVKKGVPLAEAMVMAEEEEKDEDALKILRLLDKEQPRGKRALEKLLEQLREVLSQMRDD